MQKWWLVAIAFLGLVGAAGATSINFDTGIFQSGTISGSFLAGGSLDAMITGSLNVIDLSTGPLTQFTVGCPSGSTCFSFSSGTVAVGSGGSIFKDSISGGITIHDGEVGSIAATLVPGMGITSGTATAVFDFEGKRILSGSEDVAVSRASTPELGTMLLMGAGLALLGGKYRHQISTHLL